jgi:hypothetical protein
MFTNDETAFEQLEYMVIIKDWNRARQVKEYLDMVECFGVKPLKFPGM